jgi:hypothetical protein
VLEQTSKQLAAQLKAHSASELKTHFALTQTQKLLADHQPRIPSITEQFPLSSAVLEAQNQLAEIARHLDFDSIVRSSARMIAGLSQAAELQNPLLGVQNWRRYWIWRSTFPFSFPRPGVHGRGAK